MSNRIDALNLAIREGEMRLAMEKNIGKRRALQVAISNSKIRLERVRAKLPEGNMVFNGNKWQYEYEANNEQG